ncbi:glycoside hydrolase family 15 protein [Streptomyces noursei]|uniref:glycoside hydrolase family 15 protein n=1 Tax=Streptomyces noursei TaxID=1971 RepID=UPI0035DDCB7D
MHPPRRTSGAGTFLICLAWLIVALMRIGRAGEAEVLTEALLSAANDVGLLAEEWDPVHARQLGNVPQAFSHLAVVLALQTTSTLRCGPNVHEGPALIGE